MIYYFIRNFLILTCLVASFAPRSATAEPEFSAYGLRNAGPIGSVLDPQPSLGTLVNIVQRPTDFAHWLNDSSGDILLGVPTPVLETVIEQTHTDPDSLSYTRLGALWGAQGKDVLILAPDNYQVRLPEIYAVSKRWYVDDYDAGSALQRLLTDHSSDPAALEWLAAFPAPELPEWPMRAGIVRYPQVHDDDDGDDGCGCEDNDNSQVMTCDPDGYSQTFRQDSGYYDYRGPEIDFSTGRETYGYSTVEGDDNCPVCENARWRAIESPAQLMRELPQLIGDPSTARGYEARDKLTEIYDEATRMPFETSVIYVMACDPD